MASQTPRFQLLLLHSSAALLEQLVLPEQMLEGDKKYLFLVKVPLLPHIIIILIS